MPAQIPPRPQESWDREREFTFTEENFRVLSELAGKFAGIHVPDTKRELIYGRLTRRLRQLGLKRFEQYCEILQGGNTAELEIFINAITTNLTSFFREAHHFEFLRQDLLPQWIKEVERSKRGHFRLWCAGCSTGEEAYTIAMTVMHCMAHHHLKLEMIATDLDSNVLAHAKRGIYDMERIENVEEAYLRRWFLRGKGKNAGQVRVSPRLQEMIEFRQHNMVFDPVPAGGVFDAIFCRNVVIYFDKPTQAQVFDKFADALRMGGHLFVGHSESLFRKTERFKLVAQSTYEKCA